MKFLRSRIFWLLFLFPLAAAGFKPVEGYCQVEEPALSGWDVVSYFLREAPQKGSVFYHVRYNGHVWWFSCRDHRDRFRKNPERYLPHFEGVPFTEFAEKKLPEVDPDAYLIDHGRLLLFADNERRHLWEIRRDLTKMPSASPHPIANDHDPRIASRDQR